MNTNHHQNHLKLHQYRQQELQRQAQNERWAKQLRRSQTRQTRNSLSWVSRLAALFL
jgi:hypothetical protein